MSKSASGSKSRKETILVVEDDRSLREGLSMNLELHGYTVLTAADGEAGMQLGFDARPDLIVLDIMMPGWSGLEILAELRKRKETVPVLILSARDKTSDKVTGLDLGADDYMTKPFDLPELISRIEVMLRRVRRKEHDSPVLSFGELTIDRSARHVTVRESTITLSAKEFDLLTFFADSPGKVFTRETILERIWGWDYEGTTRTVDNFIASLRKKLRIDAASTVQIKTVPKVGYKLELK